MDHRKYGLNKCVSADQNPQAPKPAPVLPPPVAPQAPARAATVVARPQDLTIDRQVGVEKKKVF